MKDKTEALKNTSKYIIEMSQTFRQVYVIHLNI